MPFTSNSPSRSKNPLLDLSLLRSLNDEQQAAVSAPGPVLVLAGAGTGKTRVIAYRIARLLGSAEGLRPANLLALTFSRRAADEMRERVGSLCGPAAEEVGFHTFHGFCHQFLRENAPELRKPLRVLDPTEAWIFFRKILPELRPRHYFNLGDPTACIEGFLRFISRAKDEGVRPAEYAALARKIQDPAARERAQEVARIYEGFQRRMRQAGNLDFGDLILESVRTLRERPALLQETRGRYRCILVDEFQDTNVAQIELLRLLAGPGVDLFVVGDDDQAIYRFRGASFASFWLMARAFPEMRQVRLTRNYRSTPTVLRAAGRLIRCNEPDRYDPDKPLHAERPDGPPIEVLLCRDEMHEAERAVERIRQLYRDQPEGQGRWNRICVLYRAHAHREHLVERLKAAGIPFTVRGGATLLERPEIRDLTAFLRALEDPGDSVAFFRLLSHAALGLSAGDLMRISRAAKESQLPIAAQLDTLSHLSVSEMTRVACRELLEQLQRFRRAVAERSVEELVTTLAERSFLRGLWSPGAESRGEAAVGLERFLRMIRRYRELHPEEAGLKPFLWYLDCLARAPSADYADAEEETPADRVRLMTVHQAKGLEFDWVILLRMEQGSFPSRGRREPVPFPVELMREPLPKGDYHLQEERRLCYVACTRARQGLTLLTQDRARHRVSRFLQELLGPDVLARVVQGHPVQDAPHGAGARQPGPPAAARPPRLPVGDTFSYSQLETYRICPQKYVYQYLYGIPVRPTPEMQFGTDLHACLELFFGQLMQGRVPPVEELQGSFAGMQSPGRYGEPYPDAEYLRLGAEILSAFYDAHGGKFPAPLFVERPFTLALEDVWIQGVVDRVDPLPDGGVEVVDYKSGRPREAVSEAAQFQLRLYALAIREVLGLEPRRVSFYYLRENRALSFEQGPEDFERTRALVLEKIRRIRSGDFAPTPTSGKCRRCDFRSVCPASLA